MRDNRKIDLPIELTVSCLTEKCRTDGTVANRMLKW